MMSIYIIEQIHTVYLIFVMLAVFPRMAASVSLSFSFLAETFSGVLFSALHKSTTNLFLVVLGSRLKLSKLFFSYNFS